MLPLRPIIEQAVASAFLVGRDEIVRPTRGRPPAAFARQVAMYLAHVGLGLTLTDGSAFGRDRTTVRHACEAVEDRRDEPTLDLTLALLEGMLRGFGRRTVEEEQSHGVN